uniref:Uncharacterized protein n=1 Tax=Kalanchoe fedtschenkoi TaxID=63787 RepID=A0A7N0UCR7_KALFE
MDPEMSCQTMVNRLNPRSPRGLRGICFELKWPFVPPETILLTIQDAENVVQPQDVAAKLRRYVSVRDEDVRLHYHPRGMGKYGYVKFLSVADVRTIMYMAPSLMICGRNVSVKEYFTRTPVFQTPQNYDARYLIPSSDTSRSGASPGADNRLYDEFHDVMASYLLHCEELDSVELELAILRRPGGC